MHRIVVKKDLTYYAKILFLISIMLLLYGFSLTIYENRELIDPVRDFITVGNNKNTVSVTTIDDSDGDASTLDGSDDVNYSGVEANIDSGDNANATITSVDSINEMLKNDIQESYGVIVRYGEETSDYSINTEFGLITTIPILDSKEINNQLLHLKNVLELYPKGMFQEIKRGGIPLTIILINSYSDNSITGVTDSSFSGAEISVAAVHPFEESFYHESYHYIERFLMKKGATFNSWDSLNPGDFVWGNIYNGYSFSNTFLENSPFVNNYAQTSGAEDRASTFEYMMASSKASCLNYGMPIWKKADYMSRTIDYVLETVDSSTIEYWERFLY